MKVCCPLCLSENAYELEKIIVSDLIKLYKKRFGVSTAQEFTGFNEINFYLCEKCSLKFFHPPLTGSEHFYEQLQKFDWYYLEEKSEYDFASQYCTKTDRVLEIGCGRGAFAKKIDVSNYIGLELSHKAQQMAKRLGINVINETIQAHSRNNRLAYEIVCSFQVLEHVADLRSFLTSSLECLKPGGLLIISAPSADSFLSSATNNILNMPPHHVTCWSDKSLKIIGSIWELDVVELNHEVLSDIHIEWYSATVTLNAINSFLKRSNKFMDLSLWNKIISKFAKKLGQFYCRGIYDINMRPQGHSVTAVYRKPNTT